MGLKVAINGFGRIGRLLLRAIVESDRRDIEVLAINDLGSIDDNIHLLKYDSIHGRFPYPIEKTASGFKVAGHDVSISQEPNPEKLPWKHHNIDIVLECSGRFTARENAEKHLNAGAQKVLISAPATGADITVVYGVNHKDLQTTHRIVSNASCTTNCLAPMASVLHKSVGIEQGFMTTIHSYTADQRLVDSLHTDLHRARAAAQSMIPTSTGAAKAVALVLPELKGKLDGTAIRVPTPNVSLVDFSFTASRDTSIEEINNTVIEESQGDYKGVLGVVDEPLVSVDFNHTSLSSVFDLPQTQVIEGRFCRVLSWYDNEWGFANRMIDVAQVMFKTT